MSEQDIEKLIENYNKTQINSMNTGHERQPTEVLKDNLREV